MKKTYDELHSIVAGAVLDLLGALAASNVVEEQWGRRLVAEWATERGLDLSEADMVNWSVKLGPPRRPPAIATRVP